MAVDAHDLPIDFIITGGEAHDCKAAPEFIAQLPPADCTITDKGYDSEELRGITRAIATRYDKLKRNYASMVAMACGFMWLPMCKQALASK